MESGPHYTSLQPLYELPGVSWATFTPSFPLHTLTLVGWVYLPSGSITACVPWQAVQRKARAVTNGLMLLTRTTVPWIDTHFPTAHAHYRASLAAITKLTIQRGFDALQGNHWTKIIQPVWRDNHSRWKFLIKKVVLHMCSVAQKCKGSFHGNSRGKSTR